MVHTWRIQNYLSNQHFRVTQSRTLCVFFSFFTLLVFFPLFFRCNLFLILSFFFPTLLLHVVWRNVRCDKINLAKIYNLWCLLNTLLDFTISCKVMCALMAWKSLKTLDLSFIIYKMDLLGSFNLVLPKRVYYFYVRIQTTKFLTLHVYFYTLVI